MLKLIGFFFLFFWGGAPATYATVEVALQGKAPQQVKDVYLHQGLVYLALDDLLPAVSLRGDWDAVRHIYFIRTPEGRAELSPGRKNVKIDNTFYPLVDYPRFIDGRLRVSENFVVNQLDLLTGRPIYYRNLDPVKEPAGGDSTMDRLFAFLLRKKIPSSQQGLAGVTIDAGHGGLDPGVIAGDGTKEKDLTLELSLRLQKILKMNLGVPVYLSRDADYQPTDAQRLSALEHEDVDAWLLLHAGGSFSVAAQGVVIFVPTTKPTASTDLPDQSLLLAREMMLALEADGVPVAGIFSSSLVPLGQGNLPRVLLELGFLTNPQDLQRLRTEQGQQQLAEALYQGLNSFSLHRKKN
ncbi:MAG: N-acetylmuramoyl-L-alanine amidase [Deltaproteobacteria bacterium]|nr:N-acetylmuramoyl-L-alanine amidase [Deltaproteobacteria bacterium]